MTAAQNKANIDWRRGGSLSDNPYDHGTKEYDEYMMAMARLQNDNFRNEMGAWV